MDVRRPERDDGLPADAPAWLNEIQFVREPVKDYSSPSMWVVDRGPGRLVIRVRRGLRRFALVVISLTVGAGVYLLGFVRNEVLFAIAFAVAGAAVFAVITGIVSWQVARGPWLILDRGRREISLPRHRGLFRFDEIVAWLVEEKWYRGVDGCHWVAESLVVIGTGSRLVAYSLVQSSCIAEVIALVSELQELTGKPMARVREDAKE